MCRIVEVDDEEVEICECQEERCRKEEKICNVEVVDGKEVEVCKCPEP